MNHWPAAILLSCIWAIVLICFLTPAPAGSGGFAHPTIPEMDAGGTGERHSGVLIRGWLLGVLFIVGFVGLLLLGTVRPASADKRPRHRAGIMTGFLLGGLVFAAVYSAMCFSYARAAADPHSESFVGPFPLSTAWLVFGLWPVPAFLILLYVVRFNEWVFPPENLRRFEEIIQRSSNDH